VRAEKILKLGDIYERCVDLDIALKILEEIEP